MVALRLHSFDTSSAQDETLNAAQFHDVLYFFLTAQGQRQKSDFVKEDSLFISVP